MPLTVQSLCEQLLGEYEVSEVECLSDVLQFLNEMAEHKTIEAVA